MDVPACGDSISLALRMLNAACAVRRRSSWLSLRTLSNICLESIHSFLQLKHLTMRIPAEDNVPGRFELFLLGDGEKKVTEAADTSLSFLTLLNGWMLINTVGIPSSSIFTFNKEDHTLGNLLRARLLQSPKVTFAGYRVQHPLFRFVPFVRAVKHCRRSTASYLLDTNIY